MRKWPADVAGYAEMMDPKAPEPVVFTNKGDIGVVLYNFYKMTVSGCALDGP